MSKPHITLYMALSLAACDSTIENKDWQTSAREGCIARYWLPEILPKSSTSIHCHNNLDLNTSDGGFSFAPKDWPEFVKNTQPGANPHAPFVGWNKTLADQQTKGFVPRQFTENGSSWVFFCKPDQGFCHSVMW